MKEKMPQGRRPDPEIIGPLPEELKKEISEGFQKRFGEAHASELTDEIRAKLAEAEIEKSELDKKIIEKANELTNQLIAELGGTPFDISPDNIHIVKDEFFKQYEIAATAVTMQEEQLIFANAEKLKNALTRAASVIHEMLHLKNILKFEASESGVTPFRGGLRIFTSTRKDKKRGMGYADNFTGLNEAVVVEMEKVLAKKIFESIPELKELWSKENSLEGQKRRKALAEKVGMEQDDLVSTESEGEETNYAYYAQRKVLNAVISKIHDDNPEKFSSREDIKKIFFRTHFTGSFLEIGRLVEKSFGKDSFRILASMDTESGSAARVMDLLSRKTRQQKTAGK